MINKNKESLNRNTKNNSSMKFITRVGLGFVGGASVVFGLVVIKLNTNFISAVPNLVLSVILFALGIGAFWYGVKGD